LAPFFEPSIYDQLISPDRNSVTVDVIPLTLKMKPSRFFEKSVSDYEPTWCQIPADIRKMKVTED
jgi:hypothetical protein